MQLLHVQLTEVGATAGEDGQPSGQGGVSTYGNTVAWCQDVQKLLGALSGVTVLRIDGGCVAVRLLTSFHTGWEALGVCSTTYCSARSLTQTKMWMMPLAVVLSQQYSQAGCAGFSPKHSGTVEMGSHVPLHARLALHLAYDGMLDFTSCFLRMSVPWGVTQWALLNLKFDMLMLACL